MSSMLCQSDMWKNYDVDSLARLYDTCLTDWFLTVIYPDPPQGGYNPPSFHATPPNHLKFKGGYQWGVYGGVYVIVMEGVKY